MEKSLAVARFALDLAGLTAGALTLRESGGCDVFSDGAVVVKVGRYGDKRDCRRAGRGLRIARHIQNPDVSTRALHDEVIVIDGFPVTIWEHCEHVALPETMESVRLVAADVPRLWEAMPEVKRTAISELRKRFKYETRAPRPTPELRELGRLTDAVDRVFLDPLAQLLDTRRPAIVATHGDLHVGNVLVTETGFRYIDFDDVVLAPRERDLGVLLGVPLRRDQVPDDVAAAYIAEQEAAGFDGDLVAVYAMNIALTAFSIYLRDQETEKAGRALAFWSASPTLARAREALAVRCDFG